MSVTSGKTLLIAAAEGGYSVGAFNVTNIIQMKAVLEAAMRNSAPVIVQTSVTPAKFLGPEMLAAAFRALAAPLPVPAALHIDHCTDPDFCIRCVDAGYTNIMIDASTNAIDENIRQTRLVTEYAHKHPGVSVEGELGTVSGVEDQVRIALDEAALCDPQQAIRFVADTGVDVFAPAIGTAHGVYKTKNPKIDFDRFAEIQRRINGNGVRVPLVVHGGTGLSDEVVTRLVSLGGAKFNVSTNLKHVLLDTTFEYVSTHRDEYNPGKLDIATFDATIEVVTRWMNLLGSTGKAG